MLTEFSAELMTPLITLRTAWISTPQALGAMHARRGDDHPRLPFRRATRATFDLPLPFWLSSMAHENKTKKSKSHTITLRQLNLTTS